MRMGSNVVGNIQRVKTVDADKKNMLDLMSIAKFIVGAGWCRKSGADQS